MHIIISKFNLNFMLVHREDFDQGLHSMTSDLGLHCLHMSQNKVNIVVICLLGWALNFLKSKRNNISDIRITNLVT